MNISITKGQKNDLPEVLALIRELAAYERAAGEVTVTLDELEKDGFGSHPLFEIFVARLDNAIVGMAFYFISYSTWKGKCMYLEDIIVREELRNKGIGKLLFEKIIETARDTGAKRLQWQVLDWNTPAIEFYKKYGANLDNTWVNGKLTKEALESYNR